MTGSGEKDSDRLISAQDLEAIINSVGLPVSATQEVRLELRRVLAKLLTDMVHEAPTKRRLTTREMRKVENLHDRFDALLRSLQDTDYPPPMLDWSPTSAGRPMTEWKHWLDRLYFVKKERPQQLNWTVINDLLAVHERMFGRTLTSKSLKQEIDDAICFLEASLAAVKAHCEEKIARVQPWYFMAPGVDALRKHLRKRHTGGLEFSRQRLEDILSH